EGLKKIEYLQIENFLSLNDFSKIGELKSLKSFVITGSVNSPVTKMNDLYFLEKLEHLEEIVLGISLVSKDTTPLHRFSKIERLKKIEYLQIENFLSLNDFSKIGELKSLKSFVITGSVNSPVTKMNDLYFLEKLEHLEEIVLGISLVSKDTTPLHRFSKIERL